MFGFAIYTSIPSNCPSFKKTTFLPDVHCRISTNHNLIITYKIFFEVSKPIESHYEELPSMSPGHRHDHTDPGRPGLLASVLHRHRPGQVGTPGEETCGIHGGNHVERWSMNYEDRRLGRYGGWASEILHLKTVVNIPFIGFQPSFWWCRISSIHSMVFIQKFGWTRHRTRMAKLPLWRHGDTTDRCDGRVFLHHETKRILWCVARTWQIEVLTNLP